MSDMIVTIAEIQRRARRDFAAGIPLEECPLPWHSNAYATWAQVYAELQAHASPQSHDARFTRRHVEQTQGVA